jgi:hypothetical protein
VKEDAMRTKLNVQFSECQNMALEEIGKHYGNSKGAVLKIALSLLQVVVREQKAGNTIAFVRDGKVVKEITGIFS